VVEDRPIMSAKYCLPVSCYSAKFEVGERYIQVWALYPWSCAFS